MAKILIADKLADKSVAELTQLGYEVEMNPDLGAADLAGVIKGVEILVVRSTKVNADTIDAADDLSLIIRAGAGVNTIDLDNACNRGICVANCPGKNTDAVAELAIGHLIAADRQIVNASCDLRNGSWEKKKYQKACGLKGRTIGIIGLGSIGKAVAKKAAGLEMNVIAWSRSLTPEKAEELGIGYCESILDVAKTADAVALHLASNAQTKHIINAEFFNAMKDGAILVNAARGEVVDTEALKQAIASKGIRAGLDVFENEPAGGKAEFTDTDLAKIATCTPHIGASTDQASEAVADEVVKIVSAYKQTGKPDNTVNIRSKTTAKINLVVRHFNQVGVLAGVLYELRNASINIEEMENIVFEGNQAAVATLKLDDEPSAETLAKISENENIIQVMMK